jgi:hypothetical protein
LFGGDLLDVRAFRLRLFLGRLFAGFIHIGRQLLQ